MLAKISASTLIGMECMGVEVEVDVAKGLPKFHIVGLGDTAVQEAKQRVFSAIKNSGYMFPPTRITVNLAPADTRKSGPLFDLPIAIGILYSSGQLICEAEFFDESLILGELSLDGQLRHITGVLSLVANAKKKGKKQVFVPYQDAGEASLVDNIDIYGVHSLKEIFEHLHGQKQIPKQKPLSEKEIFEKQTDHYVNFASIAGQSQAKRALEIAAAGSHNILMNGSPGSGKTFMAKAYPSILPRMTRSEAFEVSEIYSIANLLPADQPLITQRPFRMVHHTASSVSIVGGGRNPSPGEISLAHRGVLFLDEIAEFPPAVLEVLRQPLEDRKITVSRASGTSEFPAHFSLISAMNPCPCGYYQVPNAGKQCICSGHQIERYQKKISGPLLDRIDLYVDISPVKFEKLAQKEDAESSEKIAERVQKARDIQAKRFKNHKQKIVSNNEMSPDDIKKFCALPMEAENLLRQAMQQFSLSARAFHRIIKVARSIADLENSEKISPHHIAESLQYRKKGEE